jgi:hypothetical protein
LKLKVRKKLSGLQVVKTQRTMVNGWDCGTHFCKGLKQSVQNWDVSITVYSWLLLITQWNSCSCAFVVCSITVTGTNTYTRHFHLSFTHNFLNSIIHAWYSNFCISKLKHLRLHTILFLLASDNSINSSVHKRIIFSEFILSVLGSYATRLPQLYFS